MKKSYRFFGGFLDRQEKWLNNMAQAGHRLQRTGKISYEFSSVQPGAYQYAVVFVAQMSDQKEQTYKDFLEDLGYRVFYKNEKCQFEYLYWQNQMETLRARYGSNFHQSWKLQ